MAVHEAQQLPILAEQVLLLAVIAVLMAYAANNTRFGRYAYAIGGNREAARLSGVNIRGGCTGYRAEGFIRGT